MKVRVCCDSTLCNMEPESQALPVVDSVSDYEKIKRIGEGTYGVVCKSLTCL